MGTYFILIGLVSLAAMTGAKRSRFWLVALGITYFVAIGWRFRVGMDWNNYVAIFDRDARKSLVELTSGAEPAFGLLVWLANYADQFSLLNIVSGAIFCIGLFSVARRCREPFLALAMATPYLVIVVALSATRQALALGVIFYLFAHWDEYRTARKVIFIILAAMFHFSALIALVFLVMHSRLVGLRRVVAAVLVGSLVLGMVTLMPERIGFYSEAYVSGERVVHSPGAIYHVLLLTIPGLFYLGFRRRWWAVYGRNDLINQLAIASVIALPALSLSSTAVDRLSLYLWPMAMYVWSALPGLAHRPNDRTVIRAILILAAVAQAVIWLLYANSANAYLPYRNSLLGI